MKQTLSQVSSLLLSVAILLVGHGLQLSLLPLRAELSGWSIELISIMGTAYFSGFLLGCITVPQLVSAVGHVRTFTVLTAVGSSALLAVALTEEPAVWIALRLATGWAISGLYLIIESWLSEATESHQRGTLLSLYTVLVLAAIAGGQQLTGLDDPLGSRLIIIGTLFIVLAALPVGLTRARIPRPVPAFRFSIRRLFATSRAATLTAFAAGLVTGSFWTLTPALLAGRGFEAPQLGYLLSATIIGGAVSQLPLGRLSDRIDRRTVIAAAMFCGATACWLTGARMSVASFELQLAAFALLGAFSMPIYSIALAHANDNTGADFLVTGTSMLLMNTLGSITGPLVLTLITSELLGHSTTLIDFYRFATGCFMGGALIALVMRLTRAAPRDHYQAYEAQARSTQGAIALDPRIDGLPEDEQGNNEQGSLEDESPDR